MITSAPFALIFIMTPWIADWRKLSLFDLNGQTIDTNHAAVLFASIKRTILVIIACLELRHQRYSPYGYGCSLRLPLSGSQEHRHSLQGAAWYPLASNNRHNWLGLCYNGCRFVDPVYANIDDCLGIESLYLCVCIQLIEVAYSECRIGIVSLTASASAIAHEEGIDVLLDSAFLGAKRRRSWRFLQHLDIGYRLDCLVLLCKLRTLDNLWISLRWYAAGKGYHRVPCSHRGTQEELNFFTPFLAYFK